MSMTLEELALQALAKCNQTDYISTQDVPPCLQDQVRQHRMSFKDTTMAYYTLELTRDILVDDDPKDSRSHGKQTLISGNLKTLTIL